MKNREIYQQDPERAALLNHGVAAMSDALTADERRTLRFELEHFVCEGQYRAGLARILDSYIANQGSPEQPAAWISGFFGSGKSHLAKMLRFLWNDYKFPEDGAGARGLARLPDEVTDPLKEISTLGRQAGGLHAAAGTLGAGAGDSVRLALLGIAYKSAGLPESHPQASFCLWLRKNNIYEPVRAAVEAQGRDFLAELNDLYVSPVIAGALLEADPSFAPNEKETRKTLREQFPPAADVAGDAFVNALEAALARNGAMPCAVIVLDEVQQYIGENTGRSFAVQEVVETCSKRFGGKLLFVGTGQTALSGTPALQRLQGRFTVNVELSDQDVETVTRRVVLAKRPDRRQAVEAAIEANAGEIDRHLTGCAIAPRSEDRGILADDYPLLPVRRRFWEHALRAVDSQGTAGQLRTQLRIVHDAVRRGAGDPLGTVTPADFLFEELVPGMLQSGMLLREIHETIEKLDDGSPDGKLKSRLAALVFLIRKLPREAGADIGVRAKAETLADLMVQDLAHGGADLRRKLPALLDALAADGVLMKLEGEYGLQTRESSNWEAEFRARRNRLANDSAVLGAKCADRLKEAVAQAAGPDRMLHGKCREPRRIVLHFGAEQPSADGRGVPVWIRDGWGASEKNAADDARAAGRNDPVIHVFAPKVRADALAQFLADGAAAKETLDYKGVPASPEGLEARQGMETRRAEAENNLRALAAEIASGAKVFQGGGGEIAADALADKLRKAAEASLARLFPQFDRADDSRWPRVIERARKGAEQPLQALDYKGKTEEHPVCAALLAFIGSGKKGKEAREQFLAPPCGWPRDAVDAALLCLLASGHLRAALNGAPAAPGQLDQSKIAKADFRVESATLDARQRIALRGLFQQAGVPCKPNEESAAASPLLDALAGLAREAGGEAPLPERPAADLLAKLQALAGNEQLLGILEHKDRLAADFDAWTRAGKLAAERLPAFQRLQALARRAAGLEAARDTQPQIEAVAAERSLLAATDPLPGLSRKLADALRAALAAAEKRCAAVYDAERQRLENTPGWRRLKSEDREAVLSRLGIAEKPSRGAVGSEEELLASLDRLSLEDWRMREAALPQLFAEARAAAEKLIEPKTQSVKLSGGPLRTAAEVKAWTAETERELLRQVEKGPVVIG